MIVGNYMQFEGRRVRSASFRGKEQPVEGITVRWLSRAGRGKDGGPAYGLRHFTADPGAVIPIHDHFYAQTMFILSGYFECLTYDPETGEVAESATTGPGDAVYVPSQVPHGMRNLSDAEPATFLCCICDVEEGCAGA
ncbi:MAG: cupin domain-containing protein [Thermodesulfobacteriota bacterium]